MNELELLKNTTKNNHLEPLTRKIIIRNLKYLPIDFAKILDKYDNEDDLSDEELNLYFAIQRVVEVHRAYVASKS